MACKYSNNLVAVVFSALLVFIIFCAGCVCWAQEPQPASAQDTPAVTGAPESVVGGTGTTSPRDQELNQPQVEKPATEVPQPIAPSEPPTGYVPPPTTQVAPQLTDCIEFRGDIRTDSPAGGPVVVTAKNGVTATYKNTITTADTATYSSDTRLAEFDGHVVFRINGQEVHGEHLTINLKTQEWVLRSANTTVKPEYSKGYIEAPVFAQGSEINGVSTRSVSVLEADTTTCDLTEPHYQLISRSVRIYPNNKIIFRHVTFYALGRGIISLPILVIPIRQIKQNPNLIPRFGQSAEEGVFVKSSYAVMGNEKSAAYLLLDLMQRKGVGKGVRYTYDMGSASGDAQLYQLFDRNIDQNTLTGRLMHQQQFGSIRMGLTSNLRSNSYIYAPQSKSFTTQLSLTRDRPSANSSLVLNQTTNETTTTTSTLNGNLTHRQTIGSGILMDDAFDYNSYSGSTTPTTARLTSQVNFSKPGDKFDWNLSAQKLTDLSDEAFAGQGIFAGIEKLPELSLVSDSKRLGHMLPFGIPSMLKLSFGEFNELPASTDLGRAYMELNTPVQRHNLTKSWSFAGGGGFRQFIYSDNTAQYAFNTSAEFSKKLGQTSTFGLTYRFQQPQGFTPFRFDYVAKYNIVNASLNIQQSEKFKLSLLTGYNFDQPQFPWQDATLRFTVQPTPSLLLYTATGYDFNRSRWRTLINQVRFRTGERFKLDIGTRYDTTRSKLALIKPQLDAQVDRKTRLQASAGYNGLTKAFDYQNYMITRDLHCWEASLVYTNQTGFYHDQSLMLYLRVKAFPVFRQFGTGAFGQALDTSVGQVY